MPAKVLRPVDELDAMTHPILKSLLLLAIICPFYVASLGVCCNKCEDPNPCTPACYSASVCPDPTVQYDDGTECPLGEGVGQCKNRTCDTHECDDPVKEFDYCDHPREDPTAGTNSGICINKRCVSLSDPCVKRGVGRINCCSPDGCGNAYGSRCHPDGLLDSGSCDPSGVDPDNPVGQAGQCVSGYCSVGVCKPPGQDPASPLGTCMHGEWTDDASPTLCMVDICDPSNEADPCRDEPVPGSAGVLCAAGSKFCKPGPECSAGEPCGICDTNPDDCVVGTCNGTECVDTNKTVGAPCTLPDSAEQGMCDTAGKCIAPVCEQ